MNPIASVSPVRSKACLNSTVTRMLRPTAANAVDNRYRRTAGYRRTSRALATAETYRHRPPRPPNPKPAHLVVNSATRCARFGVPGALDFIAIAIESGYDRVMTGALLQTFPLGTQWPTIDPFLFCAHHRDDYPTGTVDLGPDAPLDGRDDRPGLRRRRRMEHVPRLDVPGFPQHPHRGFETVTYVRTGFCDHSDSLGATARFGRGDTQWMTAGKGIVHCEMFPLLSGDEPNPLELFQIWLNLPGRRQDGRPVLHDAVEPRHADGRRGHPATATRLVDITVIAGSLDSAEAPSPPPNSWASKAEADVAIWHLRFDPGARWTMPAAGPESHRLLYAFSGSWLTVDGERLDAGNGAAIDPDPAARTRGRRRRRRVHGAPGTADRRTGGPVRTVRDEHPGRDPAGLRGLPPHPVRRLAMGIRRPEPRRSGRAASPATPTVVSSSSTSSPPPPPDSPHPRQPIRLRSTSGGTGSPKSAHKRDGGRDGAGHRTAAARSSNARATARVVAGAVTVRCPILRPGRASCLP